MKKKNQKRQAAGRLGGQARSDAKTQANRKKAATTASLWKALKSAIDKRSA
jgi:hypothetical protein